MSIILIRLSTGESVCGEMVGVWGSSYENARLRRPLRFYAYNGEMSVYDSTMLSLLKYDFISGDKEVEFNKNHIITCTKVYDEAAVWYNLVAEFVYDVCDDFTKKNLVEMTKNSTEFQTKLVAKMKEPKTDSEGNTDLSWATNVDMSKPN